MKEELYTKEFLIAELIGRKLCTTISTAETATLSEWETADTSHQVLVNELSDISYLQQELPVINKFDAKAAFERASAIIRLQSQVATIIDPNQVPDSY